MSTNVFTDEMSADLLHHVLGLDYASGFDRTTLRWRDAPVSVAWCARLVAGREGKRPEIGSALTTWPTPSAGPAGDRLALEV